MPDPNKRSLSRTDRELQDRATRRSQGDVPFIGQRVHYVARGSADGVFPAMCRPAFVTETGDDPFTVGLYVINPTGTFHHPMALGGVVHDAGDPAQDASGARCGFGDRAYLPGSWHEPDVRDRPDNACP